MSKKITTVTEPGPLEIPTLKPSTCVECACYKPVMVGTGQGNCRKNPPRAFMFLLPPAVQGPGAQPVNYNVSAWPVVNDGDWCVDGFRARIEVVQ